MRQEPRYIDSEFDDRDMTIAGQGFHDEALAKAIFIALGRTRLRFSTDQEIERWHRIDKGLYEKKIPKAWIDDRLTFAILHRWNLGRFEMSVLNTGKMQDWMRQAQRHTNVEEPEKPSFKEEGRKDFDLDS